MWSNGINANGHRQITQTNETVSDCFLMSMTQCLLIIINVENNIEVQYNYKYSKTVLKLSYPDVVIMFQVSSKSVRGFLSAPGRRNLPIPITLAIGFLANVNSRSRSLFAVARPSVSQSVVCNVRVPYSGGSNFRQYFYGIRYLGHPWHPLKISRRSSQGTPPPGELNTRGVAKYSDFGPIDG